METSMPWIWSSMHPVCQWVLGAAIFAMCGYICLSAFMEARDGHGDA